MNICRLALILLIAVVGAIFSYSRSAYASTGVYPDPPIQTAPLNYAEGKSTVTFSFTSYNYFDGWYNGYPDAYYIEIYHGSTLKYGGYVFDTSVTLDGFDPGETYSWRVYAVYDFYDAATGAYEDFDNTYWSSSATFKNIPDDKPSPPVLNYPNGSTAYAGGKFCNLDWQGSSTIVPNTGYSVDVARDSSFTSIIGSEYPEDSSVIFDRLPADGSRIYWRVIACNDFGCSDASPTASFINDCYKPSTGSGGGVTFDTCSDDYTAYGMTDYLLKDISRRGAEGMQSAASIITGLNGDNLKIEAGDLKNTQIVPMQNYSVTWNAASQSDAVRAQAYTGNFYDYLSVVFRKPSTGAPLYSFDGSGRSMYNQMNGGVDCDAKTAAYWNQDTWNVHFCQAGASQYPELVGHEWGHGVAGTASDRGNASLGEVKEPGALDEAFSDWMGLAFKNAYFGSSWNFGAKNFGSLTPNYYYGSGYVPPTSSCNADNDKCGIHTNANVPNTMFYLLAAGGVHPASKIKVGKQVGGALQGIGIETAMQLAFMANMDKWKVNAGFSDALDGMVLEINENFKSTLNYPNNLHQLKNAWAAVGVGALPNITVTSSNTAKGEVVSPVKTTLVNGVAKQYEPVWGQSITVTANPKPTYKFANWIENSDPVENALQSYTFTADSDRTLTANFVPDPGYQFVTINVGQSSAPQSIFIANTYKPLITLSTAQLSGAPSSHFTIVSDNCSGKQLMFYDPSRPQDFPYSTCTIQVAFSPHSSGLHNETLDISATDSSNGQSVFNASYQLAGTGVSTNISVSSSPATGGTATLSGSQFWGGTATATATANPGYTFAGWFENGGIVSSSASYSFTVTTSRTLLAKFTSAPGVIAAMPLSGDFGTVATGASSPSHTFTITNNGQQNLAFTAITISGINGTDFNITDTNCGNLLPPSSSCSIMANFAPQGSGARIAHIDIGSNDPVIPNLAIDLSGYSGTPAMVYYGGITSTYASTIQTAYNDAGDGVEIRLWATDFNENLSCNRPVTVNLRGGYNGNFVDKVGKTALQGALTIGGGKVIVDGLQIGGSSSMSTITVAKTGLGTVISLPAGISCGSDCAETLMNGTTVTLTAAAAPYASFIGWNGASCSGTTPTCSFTLNNDTTVTASFTNPTPVITVTPTAYSFEGRVLVGSSTAEHVFLVNNTGQSPLDIGAASLTGANASDFAITLDGCSSRTFAPGTGCTIKAKFSPQSVGNRLAYLTIPSNDPLQPSFSVQLTGTGAWPVFTVERSGSGSGIVTSSPTGINCGGTETVYFNYNCCLVTIGGGTFCHTCTSSYQAPGKCSTTFPTGTTLTLTATPDASSIFSGWFQGSSYNYGTYVTTLTADSSITAAFGIQTGGIPNDGSGSNGLTIGTTFILPGTTGVSLERQLLPPGGGGTGLSWAIVEGELPPGLNFNAETGRLSGTPAVAGNYPVTFRLTDAGGTAVQSLLPIYISDVEAQWLSTYNGTPDFGDSTATGIALAESGAVYVSGKSIGSTSSDMVTVKYDQTGNQVWAQQAADVAGKGIVIDSSGNIAVAGAQAANSGSVLNSYSEDGLLLWSQTCPSFLVDQVKSDAAHNICLVGQAGGSGALFRYSNQGTQTGYQLFSVTPKALAVDQEGNFYTVTGVVNGTADIITRKISTDGNVIWESVHDSGGDDIPDNLIIDETGAVFVSGHSGTSAAVLLRYENATGALAWQAGYGWPGFEAGQGLALDGGGGIYTTGRYQQASADKNALLLKFNGSGVIEWVKLFDIGFAQSAFTDIAADSTGNIFAAGWVKNADNSGTDLLTVKFVKPGISTP